jgi:ABC-type sugar transport system permease subunit
MMVMFLAGLSTIQEELYEAARIDGANWLQSFSRITIPMLRPIMTFVTTMSVIGGWKLFDEPKLLFPDASQPIGGPGRAVLTVVLKFYDTSFRSFDFGYGASIAYGLFIIIFVFSLITIKTMNRED